MPAATATNSGMVKRTISRVWTGVLSGLRHLRDAAAHGARVVAAAPVVRKACAFARRHKRRLAVAAGVGLAVGVTVACAAPWLGIVTGWVTGFATTTAVQASNALRRLFVGDPAST
jgi:hypothetical protein